MEWDMRGCKNVSLKRYGSFNILVVLHHLKLLTSAEKLQEPIYAMSLSKSLKVLVPV